MKTRSIPAPKDWQNLKPHPLSELVDFGVGIDLDGMAAHIGAHGYDPDEAIVLDGTLAVSDAAKVAAEPPEVQKAAVEAVREGRAGTASEAAEDLAARDTTESPAAGEGLNGEGFRLRAPFNLNSLMNVYCDMI